MARATNRLEGGVSPPLQRMLLDRRGLPRGTRAARSRMAVPHEKRLPRTRVTDQDGASERNRDGQAIGR